MRTGHRFSARRLLGDETKLAPIALALLACALLLPFNDKAFHIDDPLFVWIAQRVLRHPLDFYGFDVNWFGWTQPMHTIEQNPPLASYYAALVGAVLGFGERAMHAAFLLPAVLLIVGTWRLARHFTSRPVTAAVIALAAPVVLVSSTTTMCDVPMVCAWTWAVVVWIEGLETSSNTKLAAGALLVGVASLTKYYGACLVPLLALYTFARGPRRSALWLALPVAMLAAYQAWTIATYGHGLLAQAAQYATEQRSHDESAHFVPLITGLAFTGGCMASVLFFAHRLWSKRVLAALAAIGVLCAALLAWHPPSYFAEPPLVSGTRGWILAQVALWCAVGAGVVELAIVDLRTHRDAQSLLLGAWTIGTFAFACFVNWTVNARSILPMAPAVALLVARRLDARAARNALPSGDVSTDASSAASDASSHAPRAASEVRDRWRELAPLVPAIVLALWIAWGDMQLAEAGRTAAREIATRVPMSSEPVYFEGHWGFQQYFQELGGRALELKPLALAPGDIVVIPHNTAGAHPLPAKAREPVETIEIPLASFASTMSVRTAAGFYAGNLGVLPFSLGRAPTEVYEITRILWPITGRR